MNNHSLYWLGHLTRNNKVLDLLQINFDRNIEGITNHQIFSKVLPFQSSQLFGGLYYNNGTFWTASTNYDYNGSSIQLVIHQFTTEREVSNMTFTDPLTKQLSLQFKDEIYLTLLYVNASQVILNLQVKKADTYNSYLVDYVINKGLTIIPMEFNSYASLSGPLYENGKVWYNVKNGYEPFLSHTRSSFWVGFTLSQLEQEYPQENTTINMGGQHTYNPLGNPKPGNYSSIETGKVPYLHDTCLLVPVFAENQTGPPNLLLGFDVYHTVSFWNDLRNYSPSLLIIPVIIFTLLIDNWPIGGDKKEPMIKNYI